MRIKNILNTQEYVDLSIYIVGIGYNSEREILRACQGWIGHIDGMVWIGGKFDNYEGPPDTYEWLDLLHKKYDDKCDVITAKCEADQIEKRQMYLDLAGKAGADIAIAVDTDEYIDPTWCNWERFYGELLGYTTLTKDRVFHQWVYIPDETLWPKQGNEFPTNLWQRSGKIHKDPGSMRFCLNKHFVWCSKNITDEALYKWQLKHGEDTPNPYIFQPRFDIDGVRIRMDRTLRSKEQIEAGEQWAFVNSHRENSRQFYMLEDLTGRSKPPKESGCETWAEFEKKPHTFNKRGQRVEL